MKTVLLLITLFFCFSLSSQIALTGTSTSESCPGACDGTITLVSTNATGTVFYDIGFGPQTSPVFTGLCPGTYVATATDQLPSTATFTVVVGSPAPLTFTLTTIDETIPWSCDGSATVNISGGTPNYTVTWYDANMTVLQSSNATTIINLCNGSYYVEVTDNNGCGGTGPFGPPGPFPFSIYWQSIPCQVSSEWVSNPVSCYDFCDAEIDISSFGGMQPYTVIHPITSLPVTYSGSVTLTGICAGTHTLVINDATGNCYEYDVVVVSQPTQLSTSPTASPESSPGACDGSITGSASGGTSPYVWSIDGFLTSQPTGDFDNLCPGNYNYCVMDINGCTSCDTILVDSVNCSTLTSVVTQVNDVTCYGHCDGSATIVTTGGTLPYLLTMPFGTYTYTGTFTLNTLCPGSYTGIVSDANGCSNTIVFTINEPLQLIASASGTPGAGCTGTLNSTVSGGSAPYTYVWINCSNGSPLAYTPGVPNVCDGDYQVIVTDANGCIDSSSCVTLNSPCTLVATTQTQYNVSCNGYCDGLALVYVTGGTPPFSASVSNGMNIQFTSVGTLSGLCAGNYTIIVADNNGCSDTISATVTEPPAIVSTTSFTNPTSTTACDGSLNGAATGGTGSLAYAWVDCNNGDTIAASSGASNVCEGMYQLITTDDNGCSDTSACVTLAATNSINELNQLIFTIHPNPAQEQLFIENANGISYCVEILNTLGELLYKSDEDENFQTVLNLSDWRIRSGTYFLRISSEFGFSVHKLVVR